MSARKKNFGALAFIALCAVAAITGPARGQDSSSQQTQPARVWAVIVGISKYQKLPGGQQLQFADRDAAAFAESLKKAGVGSSNLRLLLGNEATVSAIKAAIGNWLARSASQADVVYIFFSGHGVVERDFGESYLLGFDSDPDDPYATAVSVSDLAHALDKRVRARNVLVIADAARRDFFPAEDEKAATEFVQAFSRMAGSRPGVSAILASGPGEFSREGQRWGGHGVFAKHFLDALSGEADASGDGSITADEVFEFVFARVTAETSNKQHPWRSESLLAQAIISRPQPQARAAEAQNRSDNPERTVAPQIARATAPRDDAQEIRKPATNKSDEASEAVAGAQPVKENPASIDKPVVTAQPRDAAPAIKAENRTGESAKPEAPKPEAPKPEAPKPETPKLELAKSESTKVAEAVSKPVDPPREPLADVAAAKPRENAAPASVSARPTAAAPPHSQSIASAPSTTAARVEGAEITVSELPPPPRATSPPPSPASVSALPPKSEVETGAASVPVSQPGSVPSPLLLQLEAAIASDNLLEPKSASAWDIYQKLVAEQSAPPELARLKQMLADALVKSGRAIVGGDVRADNISDKITDFKRAGQIFVRARALRPDDATISVYEKLSAAQALIALQFYDEAERALTPLQSSRIASVENALGLIHQGKLDSWQAERAFKRAIEIAPEWAAPHYNLGMLYRNQNNEEAIKEFERAVALAPAHTDALAALGDECFGKQLWQQAADAYRRAIATKPDDDSLHTKLGHALYSQGLRDEANREYQKASELRGKKP